MIPTAVEHRSPEVATNFSRAVLVFDAPAPCCGAVVPWTATADGQLPHCPSCTEEAA